MPEALWTLLGVVLGASIAGAFTLVAAILAKTIADADRAESRTARLFDARRAAYEEFQSTARSLLEEAWEHHSGLSKNRPPDYDFADALVRSLGTVRLYASPSTTEPAEALLRAVTDYASSDVADTPSLDVQNAAYQHVDDKLVAFASAARVDLGATPHV